MAQNSHQLYQVLGQGAMTSTQLCALLSVSQPTMSRMLSRAGAHIVRIGRARSTRYALTEAAFGVEGSVPLYVVDVSGRVRQLAAIYGLAAGQFYIETDAGQSWLLGESGDGLYSGLPYFLDDVRPQGFLGRQVARRYARLMSFPDDPRHWSVDQIGWYLLQEGYDLPGHIILGDQALRRMQDHELTIIKNRDEDFPRLAEIVLMEGQEGSSAGGEHQKFVCYTLDRGHVIVKFSPMGDAVDARRWRDLLIAEHHALQALHHSGITSAQSELYIINQRVYLEVQRFDRVGEKGRLPVLSLAAVDAEFVGLGQEWIKVAQRMEQMQLLSVEDAQTILWADFFGQWIANTDRHLGNLSVTINEAGFKLLPVYDMLPMMYAPERGEIIKRQFRLPVQPVRHEQQWLDAAQAAIHFWRSVMHDDRVSDDFRRIAEHNVDEVQFQIK